MNWRSQRRRRVRSARILGVALLLASATLAILRLQDSTTSTTTSTTTTTSPGLVTATPGWGVIARTQRGVAVDQRWFTVKGGARVYVLRFRKGAVAFHFHVGSEDPPGASARTPIDARSSISASEWRVGVLGAFNGGFKRAAKAGGVLADGYVAIPLLKGAPTVVIDALGQLTIGTWGVDVPRPGLGIVAARQNLGYLVSGADISPAASRVPPWGDTLGHVDAVARTGVGVNPAGDVLYAVGSPLLPIDLARALAAAGAVRAMEMDINPYWPIAGASRHPLHRPGAFAFLNPFSMHDPTIYESSWLRDFFVVVAEPTSQGCVVTSPTPRAHRISAEPLSVTCS